MKKTAIILLFLCVNLLVNAQVLKSLNCTAGLLSTTLSTNEKSTITSLTITGTIDARDFKTMRDDMPLLTDIDLSGATVVAYAGNEGTYPGESISPIYLSSEVPNYAFFYNKTIKTVILPATITEIGNYAFESCGGLVLVSIPEGTETIGYSAFKSCISLPIINIPSTVTTIKENPFIKCSANIIVDINSTNFSSYDGVLFNKEKTILLACPYSKTGVYEIPSTILTIGYEAFKFCNGLTSVVMPSIVYKIDYKAFYNCNQLTSVTIPSSVTIVGDQAFSACSNLTSITVLNPTPLDISNYYNVFYGVDKTNCILNVPFGASTLYKAANQWMDFTKIVEIPELIVSPNFVGFGPNESTKYIYVASSVAWTANSDQDWFTIEPKGNSGSDSIALTVLENTGGFRTANVVINQEGFNNILIEVTQSGVVEVTAGDLKTLLTEHLSDLAELVLTGTIDARDFKTMRDNMPMLTDIDLSKATIVAYTGTEGSYPWDSNSRIYYANDVPFGAFYNNQKIKSVILPSTTIFIDGSVFYNCKNLILVDIPEGTAAIQNDAFSDCTSLPFIEIPSTVVSIKDNSFSNCSANINVDDRNVNYSSLDGVLFNKEKTILLACPVSKTGEYKIPTSVFTLGNIAFYNCVGLTSVEIPSSVTFIGNNAFIDCQNLTSITVLSLTPLDLSSSWGVFEGVDKATCILNVPFGTSALYEVANQWMEFGNIVEMPDNTIPKELDLTNATINSKEIACFNAYNNITIAGGETSVVLVDNSNTTIIAGKSIRFLPGFHAQSGSWMDAHITTNGSFCDGDKSAIVENPDYAISTEDEVLPENKLADILNKSIKVYPNPNNGQFFLDVSNFETRATVSIYTMLGSRVYESELTNGISHKINLSGIKSGVYFVKVTDGKEQFTKKMIVR